MTYNKRKHIFVTKWETPAKYLVLDVDIWVSYLKSREGMTKPNYDFVVNYSSGTK